MIKIKKKDQVNDIIKYDVYRYDKLNKDFEIEKDVNQSYYSLWYKGTCQGSFKTLTDCAEAIIRKLVRKD